MDQVKHTLDNSNDEFSKNVAAVNLKLLQLMENTDVAPINTDNLELHATLRVIAVSELQEKLFDEILAPDEIIFNLENVLEGLKTILELIPREPIGLTTSILLKLLGTKNTNERKAKEIVDYLNYPDKYCKALIKWTEAVETTIDRLRPIDD